MPAASVCLLEKNQDTNDTCSTLPRLSTLALQGNSHGSADKTSEHELAGTRLRKIRAFSLFLLLIRCREVLFLCKGDSVKSKKSNRQVLNPTVMQNIYHKSLPQQAAPALLLWLPLIIACVLETVWVVSPWGTCVPEHEYVNKQVGGGRSSGRVGFFNEKAVGCSSGFPRRRSTSKKCY